MDTEALQENKNIIAAVAAGLLIFLAAGAMMTGPNAANPQDNDTDTGPATPEELANLDDNDTDTDDTSSSSPDEESESRFTSVEKSYEIIEVKGVGDQVAVRGENGTGEILELGDETVARETVIPHFTGVNGEIYYVLNRNDSRYLFNDGEPVSEGYSTITSLRNIGGEWAMAVQESLMPQYIVKGGEKIGQDYYEAMYPAWVNGELAHKAVKGTDNVIVHGGEEQKVYPEVGYPIEAEGKLTYRVQQLNTEFIQHGDEKIASNYSSVERVMSSEDKLTYIINDNGELKLIRDGEDLLKDNWQIHPDTTRWVGGHLAYVVTRANDEYLVYDGEIIGEEYSVPSHPGMIANVDGKIAFAAKKDGDWHVVKQSS
jgi:hypothetical protein